MEQDQLMKFALLGGAAYLLYQYLNPTTASAVEPLTTTANGAGVTVSSQAGPVPTAPVLPGVVNAPPASAAVTASALQQKAAQSGHPAPQSLTVQGWNYFYGWMTGQANLPSAAQLFPGVASPEMITLTAQQYAQLMTSQGLPIGLGATAVNHSYVRKAIQLRGMAPIHGWD